MEIFNATNLVYILGGFIKTIEISVLSIICSVVVGTVLALVKSYGPRPCRWLVSAYIELFRCTPNLLWILFIYFTVRRASTSSSRRSRSRCSRAPSWPRSCARA